MNLKNIILFIYLLFAGSNLFSQNENIYKNKIFNDNIKTVQLYQTEKMFSYPIIDIENGNTLFLSFDDIGNSGSDFIYTIIHCNADWSPSNLEPIEYIDGFEEDIIDDYENSFGTLVSYKHYKLIFPNQDMKPILSGNYILYVYEDYDKTKPLFSRRFYVVSKKVEIEAEIMRSSFVKTIDDSQELNFSIIDNSRIIFNPLDYLKVSILQNNIQDIYIDNLKVDFIKGNIYEFRNPQIIKFKAGNEYRYFNTKSLKYVNDRISSISYSEPYYTLKLVTERVEAHIPYSYAQDINGEMLITAEIVDNDELEAEYTYVDFKLHYKNPPSSGKFYVFGAISDWNISKNNEMKYDYGEQAFKLRMLLKQGFYNYQYVFVDDKDKKIDFSLTEGNHYETENNYVIYVYYRKQGTEYDELIAYSILNSVKKL